MAHYRLVTAMDASWECRLRLHKQQGWEVRGICPFPTGPAADPSVGGYRKGLSHIFSDPESPQDSANTKTRATGLSILLVGSPTPTSPQPVQASDRSHLRGPSPEGILRKI